MARLLGIGDPTAILILLPGAGSGNYIVEKLLFQRRVIQKKRNGPARTSFYHFSYFELRRHPGELDG